MMGLFTFCLTFLEVQFHFKSFNFSVPRASSKFAVTLTRLCVSLLDLVMTLHETARLQRGEAFFIVISGISHV
jgi:hypothetical protein